MKQVKRLGKDEYLIHSKSEDKTDPNQGILDLFPPDKAWYDKAVEQARLFQGPFWFSALRQKIKVAPREPNMWGTLSRKLGASGFRMRTDLPSQKSPIASCNGRREFMWSAL